MNDVNIVLVVIGGLVLVLGIFSHVIKTRLWISVPLLAFLIGVLIGPYGLNWLNIEAWGEQHTLLEELARLTLGIGLMALALHLDPGYLKAHWRSLLCLVGLLMPLMWLSSSLIIWSIVPLSWLSALLIGAILTPTDPIVAASIINGKLAETELPARIRYSVSIESGANDGLAYAFVLLPILLLSESAEKAFNEWAWRVVGVEIFGALILGLIIGCVAGYLLHWSERNNLIEKTSFLAFSVALALIVLGGAKLLQTDGIFAVFVAGVVCSVIINGQERAEEVDIQDVVNQFFTLPIFTLLGLALPLSAWSELGWRSYLAVAALLLLRRIPVFLLVRPLLGPIRPLHDSLFISWFGPIGVSTLFYAMVALRNGADSYVWVFSSLVISVSIVVHGITATPFTHWYAQHEQHNDEARQTDEPAAIQAR